MSDKKDILKNLTSIENLQLGMMSGISARVLNYPLQVWKNAAQQSLPLSTNPSVVYRGLTASCLNFGSTTGLMFLLTGFFKKKFARFEKENKLLAQIGAPLCGGLCAGVPCSLMELVMIQQQRFGGSLIGVIPRVVERFGVGTLTRGMTMTISREGLFTVAMLGLTPAIQEEIANRFQLNKDLSLVAASLTASAFATTMTHPLDTMKTCMQGDICERRYSTVSETCNVLVRKNGVVNGLFKGLNWRFLQIAAGFFLVNKIKETIAPIVFGDTLNDLPNLKPIKLEH